MGRELPGRLPASVRSAKQLYPTALDTQTHTEAGSGMLPTRLPGRTPGRGHRKALGVPQGPEQTEQNQKAASPNPKGRTRPAGRSEGTRRQREGRPPSGGRAAERAGEAGVSGAPPSSQTLGACGAGTCARRCGRTSCTGTSSRPSASAGEHAGWSGRRRRGCSGSRRRASRLGTEGQQVRPG